MLTGWKRRALAYAAALGGAVVILYTLHAAPLVVRLEVDLAGARFLEGLPLVRLAVTISDGDGQWIATSEHAFPASVYPDGPPASTPPVELKLKKGEYVVDLQLDYEGRAGAKPVFRRVLVSVRDEGRLTVRAAAGP